MNNLSSAVSIARANAMFAYYETIAGGMGASSKAAGISATHTHMTNSWNTPIEAFEYQYPLRIEAYRVRKGYLEAKENTPAAMASYASSGFLQEPK